MQLTAMYPELGSDPVLLRDYAQAAEAAGYGRLSLGDAVLGTENIGEAGSMLGVDLPEPLATLGFLAAATTRIELMTGILIAPLRPAALVAKAAATVDVLSGGRLVLGVGSGFDDVEYEALGQDFSTRGRRLDEQLLLMRHFWSEPLVHFEGEFHRVAGAGISPRPSRDIPIWVGGTSSKSIARAGRLADGWFPIGSPDLVAKGVAGMRTFAVEAGRDPASIGLQCVVIGAATPDAQVAAALAFEAVGATHIALHTGRIGLKNPSDHIAATSAFAEAFAAARA